MKYVFVLTALALAAAPARGDEVKLQSGGVINGIVKENPKEPNRVEIEVGAGTVWVNRSDVLSIEKKETPLHEFYKRYGEFKNIKNPKAKDYIELATYARDNKLVKFVRPLMEAALEKDPNNETAHRELGHELYKGRWMTRAEANQAKGLVVFEGRWVTTAERELIIQKRLAAQERAEQAKAERKKREEEERQRRIERLQDWYDTLSSPGGYYYRPSEWWPMYYRGPGMSYYNGYGYPMPYGSGYGAPYTYGGFYNATPTVDVFQFLNSGGLGNIKKK